MGSSGKSARRPPRGGQQLAVLAHRLIPRAVASFLGTVILLFANAFGAIATAYAPTGSSLNIVPILLYAQFAAMSCTIRILATRWPWA